jgi:hypothetical protein
MPLTPTTRRSASARSAGGTPTTGAFTARQDQSKDCPQCVDHMINGCPGINRR